MTPELWERLNPLFDAAIEMPSSERAAFVAEACGNDSELRRELVALIDAHEQPSSAVGGIREHIQALVTRTRPDFSPGEVVMSRFRIVRKLGSGGMGDVYEAFDLELSQVIALKAMRPEIVENTGALARFRREVQLARRLSGPNVCRIHELFVVGSGAAPDEAFLTMELLDGITLSDQIRQTGLIPWREAQVLANDICSGVATIHEAGIIHRDLKSRNIMLVNRAGSTRAVVMDFGLAHEVTPSNPEAYVELTVPGSILGTPEYMAPEQFEGKDVSPATDIYALGVVLYELATGKHLFAAPNAIGAAVLRGKRPKPASSIQKGMPHKWDLVIAKCLEYDPDLRYQSAKEIEQALWTNPILLKLKRIPFALTAGLVGSALIFLSLLLIPAIGERMRGLLFSSSEKHIAVLPLEFVGKDTESQALGDGLMDSLAGRLSDLDASNRSLWVVPANEVRARKVNDPSAAFREFGATIVVKGSFERVDNVVHLKLSLIDPQKMRQIGFVDVENQSDDLIAMQDEAVTRLGRLMNISVKDERNTAEPAKPAAYEDYLVALGYIQRFDQPGNLDLAIQALQNAVKIDDRFALAFARLGRAYTLKFKLDRNQDWLKRAQLYCKQAAEMDSSVTSTYIALADIHELTGQHDLAIQEYQRATSLDPRDPDAYSGIANSYQNAGELPQAEAAYRKAADLRPEDWNGYDNLGSFYDQTGRIRDAIGEYTHALRLTPNNSVILVNLGIAYLDSGDPKMLALAEDALEKSIAISPTYQAYANLANLYGIQRRFADSAIASQKALQINDGDYNVWNNLTDAYEGLGEDAQASASRKRAIALAERAVQLNSQDADARATLAALFASAGESAKAAIHLRASLLLAPNNPYVLSEIADAYESLGNRKQAIRYLERALQNGLPPDQLNGDPLVYGIIADPNFHQSSEDGPFKP